MLIAIEGMDGSGKSTIAKELSKRIGYVYENNAVKKLWNLSDNEYEILCNKIYEKDE